MLLRIIVAPLIERLDALTTLPRHAAIHLRSQMHLATRTIANVNRHCRRIGDGEIVRKNEGQEL